MKDKRIHFPSINIMNISIVVGSLNIEYIRAAGGKGKPSSFFIEINMLVGK